MKPVSDPALLDELEKAPATPVADPALLAELEGGAPVSMAPRPSKLESLARGGAQGATLGYSDELTGLIESMLTEKSYEQSRNEARENNRLAKEENPLSYGGGQVGGSILSALAVPQATAGKLGAVALKMGALGAAQGVGESDADLLSEETAKQAALSGLIGGTMGAGTAGILNRFKPEVLDDVAMGAGKRAMGYTKRLLNTPQKIERSERAVRTALDEDILKPFASGETMLEGAEALEKRAGENIGEFLKSVGDRGKFFDPRSAIGDLESLRPVSEGGRVLRGGLYDQINTKIDDAIATIQAHGNKPMTFETANKIKGTMQDAANYMSNKNATLLDKQIAGRFRESIDTGLENVSNTPRNVGKFEDFLMDKSNFGAANDLQEALMNRVSSDQGNAFLGLRDTAFAAAELASTGSPMRAMAAGGVFKGARTYGNQAISWSADRLSKAIQSMPQAFQKWMPTLRTAMARGPQGLAVTSFILQQTDPSYSETLQGLEDGK